MTSLPGSIQPPPPGIGKEYQVLLSAAEIWTQAGGLLVKSPMISAVYTGKFHAREEIGASLPRVLLSISHHIQSLLSGTSRSDKQGQAEVEKGGAGMQHTFQRGSENALTQIPLPFVWQIQHRGKTKPKPKQNQTFVCKLSCSGQGDSCWRNRAVSSGAEGVKERFEICPWAITHSSLSISGAFHGH